MNLQENEKWLAGVAAKKISVAVISFLVSHGILSLLAQFGVPIDSQAAQVGLTAALIGAFHAGHDYLKLKYGWGWL